MKYLPELSENGKFILTVICTLIVTIIVIGEITGLTDAFINSFN